MPELRPRSRTPSSSGRVAPVSPERSPAKVAPKQSCFAKLCGKFSEQRRRQMVAIGWAMLSMLVVAGGICTVQHRVELKLPLTSLAERLAFSLRCLLLSGITLALAVKYVMYKRFTTTALNPTSGNERIVDIPNRLLQNTLEQFVLHTCVVLALSTYLNAEQMKFIPLMCVFFVLGRFFFYLGYPTRRCFGFTLTWIPTGIAIWLNIYFMITRGLAAF